MWTWPSSPAIPAAPFTIRPPRRRRRRARCPRSPRPTSAAPRRRRSRRGGRRGRPRCRRCCRRRAGARRRLQGAAEVEAAPALVGEIGGPHRGDHALGAGRAGSVEADRAHALAGRPRAPQDVLEGQASASTAISGPSVTRLGVSTMPSTRQPLAGSRTVALFLLPPLSRPTTTQAPCVYVHRGGVTPVVVRPLRMPGRRAHHIASDAMPAGIEVGPVPRHAPSASKRKGIGLCLSGGGFRASLFHLGALQRLNELGILARKDFQTITSVSGGSITAAALATALANARQDQTRTDHNGDLGPRGARPAARVHEEGREDRPLPEAVPALEDLEVGDHGRGPGRALREGADQAPPQRAARAAAVPLPRHRHGLRRELGVHARPHGGLPGGLHAPARGLPGGAGRGRLRLLPPALRPPAPAPEPRGPQAGQRPARPQRDACLSDFRLTDGGDYDNMGLEPVWKSHAVVLVSDAGGLFTEESDKGLLWRIPRYQGIQERQARALRKRWLIASFCQGTLDGTYWSVGSAPSQYDEDRTAGLLESPRPRSHRRDPHRPRRLLRRGSSGAGEPRVSARRRRDAPACPGLAPRSGPAAPRSRTPTGSRRRAGRRRSAKPCAAAGSAGRSAADERSAAIIEDGGDEAWPSR